MQISENANNGYQFQYWLQNGQYYSSNPTINVNYGANTVKPVFTQTEYTLTINAYDDYGWIGEYPAVYVDGNYVGSAPLTVLLPAGYHTISLQDPTYDWVYGGYVGFYYATDNNNNIYYSNEIYMPIYSDASLYAVYDPGCP
jgi:hypothetical protein